jgi:hypothetical protein
MNGAQQQDHRDATSQGDLVQQLQRQVDALTAKVLALEAHQSGGVQHVEQSDKPPQQAQQLNRLSTTAASTDEVLADGLVDRPATDTVPAAAAELEQPPDVPMSAARVVMHELVLGHMGDAMAICYGGQVSVHRPCPSSMKHRMQPWCGSSGRTLDHVRGAVQVLSWIDICAGLAAKAVAQGPCVTAR